MTRKKEKSDTDKPGVTKLPAAKPGPASETAKLSVENVLAEMKRLAANDIREFTSTLLRDKLGLDKESGRDQIRRAMKKLQADGKVTIGLKEQGKRKQYVYGLKEQ